jgi:predicted nuclease with TOPRIM domain
LKIAELEKETARLYAESCEWRETANAESELRKEAEIRVDQLQRSCSHLKEQVHRCEMEVEDLKNNLSACYQGLDQVLPVLADLRARSKNN